MAAEFQTHVNDLMREADLEDVRKHIDEIRNFDIKGTVETGDRSRQSIRRPSPKTRFAGRRCLRCQCCRRTARG